MPAPRFLAERLEDARINPDRDQTAGFVPEWRPPHSAHPLQLIVGRFWNIRVVNSSRRTPRARGGSPAAR
jgi:hypothetical protein